jgi:aspartate racemase
MKTIGLIGGMSWESTRLYYEHLNRGVQQRLGGLHSARILLSSLDFAPIAAMQSEAHWDEAAALLTTEALRLEKAGADVIAITANTMHKCAPAMLAALQIPLLHIVDPLVRRLADDGRKRPLLLATRFTMEGRFFIERLEAPGLQPIVPSTEGRTELHRIIYEELCHGIVSTDAKQFARELVADAAALGADSVILGCTEICMVIQPGSVALPVYDTTTIHAAALVDFSLSD